MKFLGSRPAGSHPSSGRPKVRSINANITTIGTDVIVNAANDRLLAGGGVCGAIFAAAGHSRLQAACDALGTCPTGSAVATPAFALEKNGTRHIIHAVGPVYRESDPVGSDQLLVSAYRSALRLAESLGTRTIAIPAISTGIFKFPPDRAAPLVAGLLANESFDLDEIILLALDDEKTAMYADALAAAGLNR